MERFSTGHLRGELRGSRTNYPLLFDRHLQPKLAFDAVIKALQAAKDE